MPYPKIYVDAMLLNWADRLFPKWLRHTPEPRLSRMWLHREAARAREQVTRTLAHSPEVIVRVANKASSAQGMGAVRRHLRYISRNWQLELEDEQGERIRGREAADELIVAWQFGGWGIPWSSQYREVFNILLSMPPGTDRQAMHDAARSFAAHEFGDGRLYVFAVHDDAPHPHVHLSVQARGPDGRRLHPDRDDFSRWRERFAEQLRHYGVEANASPRRTRGVTQRFPAQGVTHMLRRGEVPRYWRPGFDDDASQGAAAVLSAWREVAHAMAASSANADREVALDIVDFVKTRPMWRRAPLLRRVEPQRSWQAPLPMSSPPPGQILPHTPEQQAREQQAPEGQALDSRGKWSPDIDR